MSKMYYLTESNSIISDKQIKNIKGACLVSTTIYDNEFQVLDRIKKQSENVFDLIEVGDLIRYNDEFLGTFPLREVYLHNGELQLLDEINIKCLEITKIYKPNSKGDYIKVWESDSNEQD